VADIFVSYTSSDRDWAFWIARELETLGHTPHVHEWEIKGGDDIYAWMEARHDAADHVLCVISDDYLKAPYSTLERNAALWQAASKRPGFVLLVAVKPCRLPTLTDHLRRCELYGLSDETARQQFSDFFQKRDAVAPIAFPGEPFAVSNVPIRVPEHFIGRSDALAAIGTQLEQREGRVAVTALHGMRGVGKTTLAAAYAERHRENYRVTWWIRADSKLTMRADLISLGVRLRWILADEKEDIAFVEVMERLRNEGNGLLLIFDNADPETIRPYLPRGGAAHVLATSNAHNWRGIAESVEIRIWSHEVGADYLISRTGFENDRISAEALSKALGGLPLAHEQAAAYCERLETTFTEYHDRFVLTPISTLNDERHAAPDYHEGLTVAKTFTLAIDEAAKRHRAAEPLIVYAALLAPEPIPLYLFSEARAKFSETFAPELEGDGLVKAVAELRHFALVDRERIVDERDGSTTTDCIRLHRLVRQVAKARRDTDKQSQGSQELLEAVAATYPTNVHRDPDVWPRARRLDTLAMTLANDDSDSGESAKPARIRLLKELAMYRVKVSADYASARSILDRALAISETLGPEHPSKAAILNSLASLLQAQGNLSEARKYCERALEICEKVLGPSHPDTAENLNDLGYLLQEQKDMQGARHLLDRALAIREDIDPLHPDTATCLNNLGLWFEAQEDEDFASAQQYFERALTIREMALKPGHPDIAVSLHNLASCLQEQQKLMEALLYYKRALAMHEKAFGPEHPDTAMTLNNMGYVLQEQKDFEGARECYERALAVRKKVLGPVHRDTAMSLSNLGVLWDRQRDYTVARPYFERALAVYEKLDPRSLDSVEALYNLASLLSAQGNVADARKYLDRSFEIYEKLDDISDEEALEVAEQTAGLLDELKLPEKAAAIRLKFGL
jgi:tetratricopeptide (TPR) repeat protein